MAAQTLDLNAANPHEEESVTDPNPSQTLEAKPDRSSQEPFAVSSDPTAVDPGVGGSKKDAEAKKATVAKVASSPGDDASQVSETQKKIRRAERFGMPVQLSEEEKRNSRAERFGIGSNSYASDALKKSEEQKRKARAERFGLSTPFVASEEEAKKKARLERFGVVSKADPSEEEKRKARAIRFANSSNSSSKMNGEGDIEPKAAIVGEASGGV